MKKILLYLLLLSLPVIFASACAPKDAAPNTPGEQYRVDLVIRADAGDRQVTLEWQVDPAAVTYNIYYLANPGHTPTTTEMQQNGTKITGLLSAPHTITGLTNGTTYWFTISGFNSGGESYLQKPPIFSTPIAPPPPPAPENVRANAGNEQVTVTWTPVTADPAVTSYNVYCVWIEGTTAGVGEVINVPGQPSNSSVVHEVYWTAGPDVGTTTHLTNGITHYFWVSAVNDNGESSASFTVSAVPSATPPPFAPQDLVATNSALGLLPGEIYLDWSAFAGDTSYNVYVGIAKNVTKDSYSAMDIGTVPVAGYKWSGLDEGRTYYFVVTAVNASGESAESIEVHAIPKASP